MKTCTECKKELPATPEFFHRHKKRKDGLRENCKECIKVKSKIYSENNKEVINERRLLAVKEGRVNKEKREIRRKRYVDNNREKVRAANNRYEKLRKQNDPDYAMMKRLRRQMARYISRLNTVKSDSTINLLGCTMEEFKKHLESLFTEGMSWENRSEWDLDHVKPCASFDLTNPDEQKECFNYKNIQPLWKKDNQQKGSFWNDKKWTKKDITTKSKDSTEL